MCENRKSTPNRRPSPAYAIVMLLFFALGAFKANVVPALSQDVDTQVEPEYAIGANDPTKVLEIDLEGGKSAKLPITVTADGDAVFGGDMVLGSIAEIEPALQDVQLQSIDGLNLFGLFKRGNFKWPKGILRYKISLDFTSPGRIRDAIQHWQSYSKFRFEEIASNDGNFVLFVNADPDVCNSRVGMVGGQQLIRLGRNCRFGNAVHEIGHAIGLGHEQMRSDRGTYVEFHAENVRPGYESQFEPQPWAYIDAANYCYESIMHYSAYAWSKNGSRTLVPLKNISIGQRVALADCDVSVVDKMYEAQYLLR